VFKAAFLTLEVVAELIPYSSAECRLFSSGSDSMFCKVVVEIHQVSSGFGTCLASPAWPVSEWFLAIAAVPKFWLQFTSIASFLSFALSVSGVALAALFLFFWVLLEPFEPIFFILFLVAFSLHFEVFYETSHTQSLCSG
jgi:hypothetical protein